MRKVLLFLAAAFMLWPAMVQAQTASQYKNTDGSISAAKIAFCANGTDFLSHGCFGGSDPTAAQYKNTDGSISSAIVLICPDPITGLTKACGFGTGSVSSVGLTLPSFITVTGSPITSSGTIAGTLATQTKNSIFSGPASGADAAPTFRALVGADLPLPAVATLGGVFSKAAVSHNFLTSISAVDGSVGQAQPQCADISDAGTVCTAATGTSGHTLGFLDGVLTFSGTHIYSSSGSSGVAAALFSGTILTGQGTTNNFPAVLVQPSGASAVTTWSTNGTIFGVNAPSSYSGNFLDFHVNGGASIFSVTNTGAAVVANITASGTSTFPTIRGGSTTSAVLTLESTSGSGATDSISIKTGAQVAAIGIDTNQLITLPRISTGTNADFVCASAGLALLIQSSSCTISSRRFKENIVPFTGRASDILDRLTAFNFDLKAGSQNVDKNAARTQTGIMAEDVAKVAPTCAIFEKDMKTPKSYRQECIIALLIKQGQEQNLRLTTLTASVYSITAFGFVMGLLLGFMLWSKKAQREDQPHSA